MNVNKLEEIVCIFWLLILPHLFLQKFKRAYKYNYKLKNEGLPIILEHLG